MLGGSLLKGQKVFLIVSLLHFLKKQKKYYLIINTIIKITGYLSVSMSSCSDLGHEYRGIRFFI
jgi:hypothetical protein